MAKYQIVGVLLTPKGNYDEKNSPKALEDFDALEKAWKEKSIARMHDILTGYCIENGAIEEHDLSKSWSVQRDADGYYLLKKI